MGNNYSVYRDANGWAGKPDDSSRASVRADTQADAYQQTRDLMARNGGGEISVHGVNGQIRDKNTIAPAHDPRQTEG